ncbi:hypothetical protein [Flexithrix dorotheae]|uniref:hypothetical protein n=1 Tax=Flexithrix dorotheae TaxID=70993 RepID=UPI00038261BF|nr:hypothetical protein [Flexithrix dorotheae]
MLNPIRRNKNIGTGKQGVGKSNKLVIPDPDVRHFCERLGNYKKTKRVINNHEFIIIEEETNKKYSHACSLEDIVRLINLVPKEDYGELKYIILRQPKHKENLLSPVWGKLMYSYEFENEFFPAIILESQNYTKPLKWPKKLSPDSRLEVERLKEDGHLFVEDKRHFTIELSLQNVRSTQLFRTIFHEFGHYVHYMNIVEKPGLDEEEIEEWDKRYNYYFSLPSKEKETFANQYAENLRESLKEYGLIPF